MGNTSPAEDRKRIAERRAANKIERDQRPYRLNGEALDGEPQWSALTDTDVLEQYTYGAGWMRVLNVRPIMASDVTAPVQRTYYDRTTGKKRTETVYKLAGPIWPPRKDHP